MSRSLPALSVFLLVLACGLISLFVPLPLAARILLSLAGAFIATGAFLCLPSAPVASVAVTEAAITPPPEISHQLRHDLRGLISPAMLAADQLSLSTDQATRTRAEQILAALDRLAERLKTAKT
ncbi:MAG: hypothetical protein ABF876_03760 [Acetobacter aceti]|uniref:Uncharacterized protein n=1 Tax=Acetobacter aceti TaxID=435 RepID=A0A1U9KHX9_ACEAC|nr:hypothetical protein [Acetobacter aceti]AQS85411.1 hypothetical protein A0U92_12130 [Acetobacter aceti]